MPTVTLRPIANGDVIQLSPHPSGTPNWDCVNDETSDGDSTYVVNPDNYGSNRYDLYKVPSGQIPSNSQIIKVTIYINCRAISDRYGYCRTALKTNGSVVFGSAHRPSTSYTIYSDTYETNPVTGNAWTVEEIDNLQIGVRLDTMYAWFAYYSDRCTQVWAEVEYQPAYVTHKQARLGTNVSIRPHAIVLIKRNDEIVGYRKPHTPFAPERPIQPEVGLWQP